MAVEAARLANADDADELVRLRAIMLGSMSGAEVPLGDWSVHAAATFRARLSEATPTMMAFVVDAPDGAGLAACAVGFIEVRLASLDNPTGERGHISNVVTDPRHRRRGYARASVEALLAWFAERGVTGIGLNASSDGEPLYESLGFRRSHSPAMRLSL